MSTPHPPDAIPPQDLGPYQILVVRRSDIESAGISDDLNEAKQACVEVLKEFPAVNRVLIFSLLAGECIAEIRRAVEPVN